MRAQPSRNASNPNSTCSVRPFDPIDTISRGEYQNDFILVEMSKIDGQC